MPNPAPSIIRLAPFILKLFPQLAELMVRKGDVIGFAFLNPKSDEEVQRLLARAYKPKPRERGDNEKDSSQVIKLSDAIKAVEHGGNAVTPFWAAIKSGVKIVALGAIGQVPGQNGIEEILDPIVKEMREKALRQDTPRAAHRSTKIGRPARGHGHGRRLT